MATYAIGDVQGCLQPLEALLKQINFDQEQDTLWFVGDLINRGPNSLATLRFIKSLGEKHISVLGNHDLHLLAVAYGVQAINKKDTINDILEANDREELITWLRHRPLLHVKNNFTMVHAGLAPIWNLKQAMNLASEVETCLRGDDVKSYLAHMYGNAPTSWQDDLQGFARFRCIINYMTRMRYCYEDGSIDLNFKGKLMDKPADLMPWYEVPVRKNAEVKIIFGHWASLEGRTNFKNVYALDTGCVWGQSLTALRLEDEKRFSVKCVK